MRHHAINTFMACSMLVLAACGGGGGGDGDGTTAPPVSGSPNPGITPTPTPTPTPLPPATGSATLAVDSTDSKLPWRTAVATATTLKDANGSAMPSTAVTCNAIDTAALEVAADCSSVRGLRLGIHKLQVVSGSILAYADVQVIPQRQPFGTYAVAGGLSNGGFNLLSTAQGTLLGWGYNLDKGTLGQGKTETELPWLALPTPVKDTQGTGNLSGIVAASAGTQHALALDEQGQVYSWGCMCGYRLGHGFSDTDDRAGDTALPGLVRNSTNTGTLQGIVQVAAGQENSVALSDQGTVYTWGNYLGHAQYETTFGRAKLPALVVEQNGAPLQNIVQISSGRDFALALAADGRLFSWGKNYKGQLGNGAIVPESERPNSYATLVVGASGSALTGIRSVAASYNFAVALAEDGTVYTWGSNGAAQLATGDLSIDYTAPELVAPRAYAAQARNAANDGVLSGIRAISTGGGQVQVLDEAGTVWSWGQNLNGELGDGAGRPRGNVGALPAAVVGEGGSGTLSGIISIASGYGHALALKADGTVLLWGDNDKYNLGQGEAQPLADSPVPLSLKSADGKTPYVLSSLAAYPNLLRHGR
jgi:alpha-tubulin suppressor-like RCC1 family protein